MLFRERSAKMGSIAYTPSNLHMSLCHKRYLRLEKTCFDASAQSGFYTRCEKYDN